MAEPAGGGTRQSRHTAAFVAGVVLGAAAGAAWTLFKVPRSGAETRAALVNAAGEAARRAEESVRALQARVRERGERLADRVALALDAVTGGTEDAIVPAQPAAPVATASGPAPGSDVAADGALVAAPEAPGAVDTQVERERPADPVAALGVSQAVAATT